MLGTISTVIPAEAGIQGRAVRPVPTIGYSADC